MKSRRPRDQDDLEGLMTVDGKEESTECGIRDETKNGCVRLDSSAAQMRTERRSRVWAPYTDLRAKYDGSNWTSATTCSSTEQRACVARFRTRVTAERSLSGRECPAFVQHKKLVSFTADIAERKAEKDELNEHSLAVSESLAGPASRGNSCNSPASIS